MHVSLSGQFPHTRPLEIRSGQLRPAITTMAQDADGLLWLGSDIGLLRTDGERVEVILRNDQGIVTALHAESDHVFVALDNGMILRCGSMRCDTLLSGDRSLVQRVNAMMTDTMGRLWIGTHGKGIAIHDPGTGGITYVQGLRDDHVNDLALLPDGRMIAATDQGLALCKNGAVERSFGEAEGSPDNLTICVTVNEEGMIWAGTDRSGAFRWDLHMDVIEVLDSMWNEGEISTIAVQGEVVWMGTRSGALFVEEPGRNGSYASQPHLDHANEIHDLLIDKDGAVWWCNGTDILHSADGAILFVPEHEGVDLRNVTALCSDPTGRIWFATPNGLYHHAAAFAGHQQLTTVPVQFDQRTPVVSLASTWEGTIWAAT
ncbi:MAG: hypothetical protein M3R08_01420, partial [Bacteroidota bacterium]|nr:hypothetical protein [Bacteroidota bacterium]